MLPRLLEREQGAMTITMSLMFIVLIGFAALAVDIGHLMIARNELQNAADAAALAGANCLDKATAPSGTDCTSAPSGGTVNWSIAGTKANDAISLNNSDGSALVSATVSTGYKNLTGTPSGLQPITLTPIGTYDKPAVMVTVSRNAGLNGGPVQTLITAMFGGAAIPMSATAVAVISSPGSVIPGRLIPQAINKCMYDRFWDYATASPKLYTGDPPDPYGLSTPGLPWVLRIGSAYHYDTCYSGQWTSFDLDVNSQSAIEDLIENGNPNPMQIGDDTWIQPGTKTASYYDLDAKYPTPPGADVTLIVVDLATDLSTKGEAPIVAFAGFHIDDVQGGSDKYIEGHFVKGMTTSGSSGIGPFLGTYTPPRLAQ